ncbi:MAG TPA: UvrD-helicase domain-containing protein [Solirubrobacterales bacterium]
MSAHIPTREQTAAIAATGRDVLVEAGAGTGKTGVIVERYCRLVCDEGVSPDAVLAFTFTEKAAAELRQRIRAALQARADTGSERARELVGEIGRAWVTTIHGFCNRVLAGHPVAAGIDPRIRVLDHAEAERAASEAFDEALEEFLAEGDEAREQTLAAFDIDGLRSIVVDAHDELRSRGFAEPRLPKPPAPDAARAVQRAADASSATLEELPATSIHRERVERALAVLDGAGGRLPSLDQLMGLRSTSTAKSMEAYRDAIEMAVTSVAEAGEGAVAYSHVAALLELFSARFQAAKERRAGVDFEDLQILATRLLEQGEVGESYRARFAHLLVDEFQDTNRLQLRLIEALRGPRTEVMVVGDELQSIYGFRHADLDVFREQRRAIESDPKAEATALSGNFRSSPEVIGAVNAIGEKLLDDAFRPLRVGAMPNRDGPQGEGPAVELLLTAREGWDGEGIDLEPLADATTPLNQLAEARFVAARLRELVDAGVERGNMVVLLRAFTHLDAYEDSLERAGLRPYVVGGRGYWSQQQVADVRALLATIANPLDDQALFGALASPACGVTPDTLWLLRAAVGRGRHIWPAIEQAVGTGTAELAHPERLSQIAATDTTLLHRFAETIADLRERASRMPLADLIDTAVTETGYDLAVLMRPMGEARFANVRKLMRLAAEFEEREGRNLRGLLDFLASRAEADIEAMAATTVEGHDGVRIMTIHSAKGLEFDVVAIPQLGRRLLGSGRVPPLIIGHEGEESRVGIQLRRLGAASLNLFGYPELREKEQERDAEEELRLFHVAATRARERLILSGVVNPKPGKQTPGTPVVERIVDAFGIDREHDSSAAISAPLPRAELKAGFEPSELFSRVSLPSPERAAELCATTGAKGSRPEIGKGPAPLVQRHPPSIPNRPLSYTALAAYDNCAYRFYLERVLGLRQHREGSGEASGPSREERTARGRVVHELLEWSHANGWAEPTEELVRRFALAEALDAGAGDLTGELSGLVRSWLRSDLLRELLSAGSNRMGAEVPILLGIDGNVLRGSIDLLVERDGSPPLVVDYKTDRLNGESPAAHAARYATQRAIYALAVAEAREAPQVELAYVFLELPNEPSLYSYGPADLEAERRRLREAIERIGSDTFQPAPPDQRDWALCDGCPALKRMCSGPQQDADRGVVSGSVAS